jgi:hypothetical protein
LLKQLKDPSAGETVANEARVYRFLQDVSAGDTLLRYLPRVLKYDSGRGMLVVELLRSSKDLFEHCQRHDRVPVDAAACLGRALSSLHRITGAARGGGLVRYLRKMAFIHCSNELQGERVQAVESEFRCPILDCGFHLACKSIEVLVVSVRFERFDSFEATA